MNFYTAEQVNDHLTLIRSRTGELLYLAQGRDRAVLIDTCAGYGNLKEFVSTLTDKPLFVLLTHGHIDHAMGAPEFDEVWMNQADLPLYCRQCSLEERTGYLTACLGPDTASFDPTLLVPAVPDYPFHTLQDGDCFDLGGLHIEAVAFPGHTPGCMVFLLRELGILITGDACNNATFLFDGDAATVTAYRAALLRVKQQLDGRFDRVFLSHHVMEASPTILDEMLTLTDEVLAGQCDDLPYQFMGMSACIARQCDQQFRRADGKWANLIYSKEKLS